MHQDLIQFLYMALEKKLETISGLFTFSRAVDLILQILTDSRVSVAQKFFSSIPSSTASVSLYGPFRTKTLLPAGSFDSEMLRREEKKNNLLILTPINLDRKSHLAQE